jgi:hypothetical protein
VFGEEFHVHFRPAGITTQHSRHILADQIGLDINTIPYLLKPKVVRPEVCGMTLTLNVSAVASLTVRLIPSMATEPFQSGRA